MRFLRACVMLSLLAACAHAQIAAPKITGIARVGYFVSDMPKAVNFWHGLLGFDVVAQPGSASEWHGRATVMTIHAGQRVELFEGERLDPPGRMRDLCFTVSDLKQMKAYLRAQGVTILGVSIDGQSGIAVEAPDRVRLEFVQAGAPTLRATQSPGASAPPISTNIFHVGFAVGDSAKAIDFYGRMLGFKETWRGSADGKTLSWINMRVPDGTDYIELMLKPATDAKGLGTQNHVSLAVPDMDAAAATLTTRASTTGYELPIAIRTGVNRKRQVNLFDPDGTRVELMEPFTVDGKPAVSSAAPPPAAQ